MTNYVCDAYKDSQAVDGAERSGGPKPFNSSLPAVTVPVHDQAQALQLSEFFPRRPVPDQVGVGDQDARRPLVRLKYPDGLPGLHEQRLIVLQPFERFHQSVIALPVARRLPRAAVDDQVLRAFGDLLVEVVHQHPKGGFLVPTFARQARTPRSANRPVLMPRGDKSFFCSPHPRHSGRLLSES